MTLTSRDWPTAQALELLHIEGGGYRATVAPAVGGRLATLSYLGTGGTDERELIVPMGPRSFPPETWPKAGAFPMLPFANRLPNGPIQVGGRQIEPDAGLGHPLHGFGHRRRWTVVHQSIASVQLELLHDGCTEGWPWPFLATQSISLNSTGAVVTLAIQNLDAGHAMPLAFGWHPYHPVRDTSARVHVAAVADEQLGLDPSGLAQLPLNDRVSAVALGADSTCALKRWSGTAAFELGDGHQLRVSATGYEHLVLHRPAGGQYVCLEPVAVLPGHLSRAENTRLLQAGETAVASWHCGCSTDQ